MNCAGVAGRCLEWKTSIQSAGLWHQDPELASRLVSAVWFRRQQHFLSGYNMLIKNLMFQETAESLYIKTNHGLSLSLAKCSSILLIIHSAGYIQNKPKCASVQMLCMLLSCLHTRAVWIHFKQTLVRFLWLAGRFWAPWKLIGTLVRTNQAGLLSRRAVFCFFLFSSSLMFIAAVMPLWSREAETYRQTQWVWNKRAIYLSLTITNYISKNTVCNKGNNCLRKLLFRVNIKAKKTNKTQLLTRPVWALGGTKETTKRHKLNRTQKTGEEGVQQKMAVHPYCFWTHCALYTRWA